MLLVRVVDRGVISVQASVGSRRSIRPLGLWTEICKHFQTARSAIQKYPRKAVAQGVLRPPAGRSHTPVAHSDSLKVS